MVFFIPMKVLTLPDKVIQDLQKLSTAYPHYLAMLSVVHNILFIIQQQDFVKKALDYYIANEKKPYVSNPYFESQKDWISGVLRDDWRVAFHVTMHKDETGQTLSAPFFEEVKQLAEQIVKKYHEAQESQRLTEFFEAFEFDSRKACMQERAQKAMDEDWSQPLRLQELMSRFMKTLPQSVDEHGVLEAYNNFFSSYEGKMVEGAEINLDTVKEYLSTYLGFDFSEMPKTKTTSVELLPARYPLDTTTWEQIKARVPYAFSDRHGSYFFYFGHSVSAYDVLNWFRYQEELRTLGIMLVGVENDRNGTYKIQISKDKYDLLELIHEKTNQAGSSKTIETANVTDSNNDDEEIDNSFINPEGNNEITRLHTAAVPNHSLKWEQHRNNGFTHHYFSTLPIFYIVWPFLIWDDIHNIEYEISLRKENKKNFLKLVRRTNKATLSDALVKQNLENKTWLGSNGISRSSTLETPLHLAAKFQPEAFIELIEKVSDSAINQAVRMRDIEGSTPLLVAAASLNEAEWIALVNKVNKSALDEASVKPNKTGDTALGCAASSQTEAGWMALVTKLSVEVLNNDLISNEYSAFIIAGVYQSETGFLYLINKCSIEAVNKVSNGTVVDFGYSRKLKNMLGVALVYQTPLVVNTLIGKLSIETLKKLIFQDLAWFIERYRPCLLDGSIENLSEEKLDFLFSLSKGKFNDFILKAHSVGKELPAIIADRVHTFLPATRNREVDPIDPIPVVSNLIQEGNGFLKIIREPHWNSFSRQIRDPSYRPRLRKPELLGKNYHNIFSKRPNFKFRLSTGEVTEEAGKNKEEKIFTHTRKHAGTLLSPELMTSSFGEHDPSREIVGILMDLSLLKTAALFSKDNSTVHKGWSADFIGDIKDYISSIRSSHYTVDKIQDFRNRIKNSFMHNEVLAKLPYEDGAKAIVAVVIAKDTFKARIIALKRAKELKQLFNIDVPIVFYDRFLHTITPYSDIEEIKKDSELRIADELSALGFRGFTFNVANQLKPVLEEVKNIVNDLYQSESEKSRSSSRIVLFSNLFQSKPMDVILQIKAVLDTLKLDSKEANYFVAARRIRHLIEDELSVQHVDGYKEILSKLKEAEVDHALAAEFPEDPSHDLGLSATLPHIQ